VEIVKWDVGEIPRKVIGIGILGKYWEMAYVNFGELWFLGPPEDYFHSFESNSDFGEGDIVGCGLLRSSDEAFFTKNGKLIGSWQQMFCTYKIL
jgi:hypothetical protein